jgi:hypothetical protein
VRISKLAAALAAAAVTLGIGAANVTPASAVDNIKTFGEQERLNGPNSMPYIGYTVFNLDPSTAPVPHNGTLYEARLVVDGFGTNTNPMVERFGARALSGEFYPAIQGASNTDMLFFDIVGPVPNSVVWNDGMRDILAWIPGDLPLEPASVIEAPPVPGRESYMPAEAAQAPVESDAAIVATPNPIPNESQPLTEAIVAEPGFNR